MLDFNENLGVVVKNARKREDLTQQQLADKAHMGLRTIGDIEKGKANPEFETLLTIIRILKIPADDIFYPLDEEEIVENKRESAAHRRLLALIETCSEQELQLLCAAGEAIIRVLRCEDTQCATVQ